MAYQLSQRSLTRMEGVDNRLVRVAMRAIEITKIDFGIPMHGGKRTPTIQNKLFNDGKSNADGYEKLSQHQKGLALDVFAYVDGKASWDELHLAMVAAAFLQAASELGIYIKWGGLWKNFVDMPHFQIDG